MTDLYDFASKVIDPTKGKVFQIHFVPVMSRSQNPYSKLAISTVSQTR